MTQSDITEFTKTYGSPLYVYDLGRVDDAVNSLLTALPDGSILYYSFKANPHPFVAEALRQAGCRAEVSSTGELSAAIDAGFRGGQCLYTGPGKVDAEIAAAVEVGVTRFSVESESDYWRVARVAAERGCTAECLIRINSGHSHGISGIRMTGTASQFGVDSQSVLSNPERFASRQGSRIVGFHFFALSNARTLDDLRSSLVAGILEARRLHEATGLPLEVLDLGGGFAAPYATVGELPDYSELREPLEMTLDAQLPGWRVGSPEVAFESGRYLVGTSGRLACTVTDVKRNHDRTYVVLDVGINNLGGLSGIGRMLPMTADVIPVATGLTGEPEASADDATLVGPLCTPADILARGASVSLITPGDLLVFPNVGAYGLTASLLGFLSRPAATEVALRSGVPVHASRVELRRTPCMPSIGRLSAQECDHQADGAE